MTWRRPDCIAESFTIKVYMPTCPCTERKLPCMFLIMESLLPFYISSMLSFISIRLSLIKIRYLKSSYLGLPLVLLAREAGLAVWFPSTFTVIFCCIHDVLFTRKYQDPGILCQYYAWFVPKIRTSNLRMSLVADDVRSWVSFMLLRNLHNSFTFLWLVWVVSHICKSNWHNETSCYTYQKKDTGRW